MFRIAVTNLGKYAEGELVFKWVDLTDFDNAEELYESGVLEDIGIGSPRWDGGTYEEWFISDIDCDIPGVEPYEYPGNELLDTWIELAHDWEYLDSAGEVAVSAWCDDQGSTIENVFEGIEAYNSGRLFVLANRSKEDVIREWLADGYIFSELDFDQRMLIEPYLNWSTLVDQYGDPLLEYGNDIVVNVP